MVVLSTPDVVVLLLVPLFGVVLDCVDVSTPGVQLLLSAISFEFNQLINFECYVDYVCFIFLEDY